MERLNAKRIAFLAVEVCIIITLVYSVYAFAADFPHRINSEKLSTEEGLGRDQIPLLMRIPGPGKKVIVEKLMKRFKDSKTPITTHGTVKRQEKGDRLAVIGEGWTLEVNGEGTNVRYRNYKFLDSKPELARPVSQRLSKEKLEELGSMFIKENLSEYIKIGSNEELLPFYSEHAIGWGGPAKEGAPADEERVYASTIIFTRTIDKVNVIGAGSKVAIIFNNEGTPIGFDYDWPQYRSTGKFQKVLPVTEIKKRAKKLISLDIDSPNVKVKRFDCGFYDAGVRKRDPKAVIQAGCAIHSYEKKIIDQNVYKRDPNSGHTIAAYVDFIPAGETIELDEKWPQAMKMLNKEPISRTTAPKEGPKPK